MAQAGGSRNKIIAVIIIVALGAALIIPSLRSCGNKTDVVTDTTPTTPPVPPAPRVQPPAINADSAYAAIKAQVDFGPRVPGSAAQTKCAAWIVKQCERYGLKTELQEGRDTTWDNVAIPIKNIFAQYKPERPVRILLLAHWDSRPYADLDTVDQNSPILGADDGGSGVAMLLEVARVLQTSDPNIGVDFFFSDAEDYGQRDGGSMIASHDPDSWCLGTQYWAKHNKPAGYSPRFGILLDMVGGKNPVFPREGTSMYFAPDIVEKVWTHARIAGHGKYFTDTQTGETTDDHLYINQLAGIRCIDIVHYDPNTRDYPEWHHKHSDNMNVIEKSTLSMVGDVVLETLFNEDPPKK